MEELIRQIRAASEAGLYYLALIGALVLPDICGSLASKKGSATPANYKEWLREFVPGEANDADLVYALRSSLLHQGRALPHGGSFPIAFTPSGGPQLHNFSMEVGEERVGWTSIPMFVTEVTDGAERWLREFGDTETVTKNLERFARLRPEGLPPFYPGPVIA